MKQPQIPKGQELHVCPHQHHDFIILKQTHDTSQLPLYREVRLRKCYDGENILTSKDRCFHLFSPEKKICATGPVNPFITQLSSNVSQFELIKPYNFPGSNLRVIRTQRPQGFPKGKLHQTWPPTKMISDAPSRQTAPES